MFGSSVFFNNALLVIWSHLRLTDFHQEKKLPTIYGWMCTCSLCLKTSPVDVVGSYEAWFRDQVAFTCQTGLIIFFFPSLSWLIYSFYYWCSVFNTQHWRTVKTKAGKWPFSWQWWEAAIPRRPGTEWEVRCFLLMGRKVLLTGGEWWESGRFAASEALSHVFSSCYPWGFDPF